MLNELDGFVRERLSSSRHDSASGEICVLTELSNYMQNESLDDDALRFFDSLARKIEIVGTVYDSYSSPRFVKLTQAKQLSPPELETILGTYLLLFARSGDPRFLNTVLKALDGALHLPPNVDFDSRLTGWANEALLVLGKT